VPKRVSGANLALLILEISLPRRRFGAVSGVSPRFRLQTLGYYPRL
jgi:hypothetical protein